MLNNLINGLLGRRAPIKRGAGRSATSKSAATAADNPAASGKHLLSKKRPKITEKPAAVPAPKDMIASPAIPAPAESVIGRPGAPPLTAGTGAQAPAAPESSVITKKDQLPRFEAILSYSSGEIHLTSEQQKDYSVLLTNSDRRIVTIICAAEKSKHGSVDNEFLTIRQRCLAKGYSVRRHYASRQLIQLLYEADRSSGSVIDDRNKKEGYISDFDKLILDALTRNASDVHIEVRKAFARVRMRVHGELALAKEWTSSYGRDMAAVVYQVLADEKETSFIETQQQAARIERIIDGQELGIRLNTIPVAGGFDMVLRLLKMNDDTENDRSVEDLGYSERQIEDIYFATSRPTGVIIVAGTTGSGKSVSMSTILNGKIKKHWGDDGPTIKVITVEDPTEYTIVGASQSGVVRNKNKPDRNPFAEAIKAAMRCDPDILMVGEVRDAHSAELLKGAVQSGHTVLTTIHTASAFGTIPRLRSMGVTNDVLGSNDFVSALIYQTLIPIACRSCAESLERFCARAHDEQNKDDLRLIERLRNAADGRSIEHVVFRNHSGCANCINGVCGRTIIAEVVVPTAQIRSAFEGGKDNLALYYHLVSGGGLILDHGIEKVIAGVSDPRDVENKIGLLNNRINITELGRSLGITSAAPEPDRSAAPSDEGDWPAKRSGRALASALLAESADPSNQGTPKNTIDFHEVNQEH